MVLPQLEDLKIKKIAILGTIGVSLSKLLLSHLTREHFDLKTDAGSDTRLRLMHSIELLSEPLKYQQQSQ